MLIVNGKPYAHRLFGYIEDSKLLCEMVNTSKEQAAEIFSGNPSIEFINADGYSTDYTGMKLIEFMDEVAQPGNTAVVLKK